MTSEVENVPELRFFEYQKCWETITLGEATTKIGSGKTPLGGSSVYLKSGIPFLRSQNIQNGILDLNELVYIDASTDENMKNSRTYYGDILLNITGASIGRSTLNTIKRQYANLNQHVCIIRLKEFYDSNFIGQYLISQKGQKKIFMAQSGGSREGLNFKEIGRIKFMLPTDINEQQKIGGFFSKLDRQIELEEQKLTKLEEQKKGYMQKIFSQELRFKDENGNTFEEWKNTNFNYFMSEPDNLEKGIDLRKDQLLTVKLEGNGVSKANINRALKMGSTVYYKRFAGQFIYGKQNFFNGAFGIVPKFLNNYYSSGDVPALNIDYSKIDSKYFINYISRKDYYKKKEAFSTGTGSKRIHEKTLLDFDIMLPSVEEQEKIGDFFSEIDNFIEKQSYKVELLKERKKGFLQKMFV
ncbi:restriction endonuclease subunit S [Staphylococcus gallinarum]|uniref:restriction endonuclease subunit S n=1 Tax=Staphylococcus gallinarum TaxID=1293 RepID=UPI002DB59998|nr:restriction endonuclease subunit S [Staphylococcus gallinarum]MEB6238755.1 restriction endonuclease subunit S [Staphylococcus gallinarum]